MPAYKLYYFNIRGRAEIARLIFAQAGVQYEDCRIEFSDWPEHKPKTPFGQLPVLMIDDKPLPQSGTIIRYLAKEFGLVGANNLETAYADMIHATVVEVMEKLGHAIREKDDTLKAEKMKEGTENIFQVLEKIEKKFSEKCKKNKNSFLVGDKMTYADIVMMDALMTLDVLKIEVEKKCPSLFSLKERISKGEKIKAWIDKRPASDF